MGVMSLYNACPAYTRIAFVFVQAGPCPCLGYSDSPLHICSLPCSAYEPPFRLNTSSPHFPRSDRMHRTRCYLCLAHLVLFHHIPPFRLVFILLFDAHPERLCLPSPLTYSMLQ